MADVSAEFAFTSWVGLAWDIAPIGARLAWLMMQTTNCRLHLSSIFAADATEVCKFAELLAGRCAGMTDLTKINDR